MNASALLSDLNARGATVVRTGGTLKVTPSHVLTQEHRDLIRELKPDLLTLLAGGTPAAQVEPRKPSAAPSLAVVPPCPAPGAVYDESAGVWLHSSGIWRYHIESRGALRVRELREKHAGILRAAWRRILPPGPLPLANGMECSDPTTAAQNIDEMLFSIARATVQQFRDLSPNELKKLDEADHALLYLCRMWQLDGWYETETEV